MEEALETLDLGNWCRHAPPPGSAGAARPSLDGFQSEALERLLLGESTPLRVKSMLFLESVANQECQAEG